MNYGYVRVSSMDQNVSRQVDDMERIGLMSEQIIIDKCSGKDFERENYQLLRGILKKGDLLIVKSIDRLGRNYKMIMDEWYYLTKKVECDILVLDMPLLDTRTEAKNLVGKFISDIVLQILSFVAETERDHIKKRQAEGILLARQQGKLLGRPKRIVFENCVSTLLRYKEQSITLNEAMSSLNICRSSFYKLLRRLSVRSS
jgi:DNA invertase Pin-like site-specific DNA recombinase